MFHSVRTRLTLWYAGVLALSLIAFAFLIYYAAAASFHQRQDESLLSTAQTVASAYVEEFEEQKSLTKASQVVLAELAFPNRYVQVIDNNGLAMAATSNGSTAVGTIPLAAPNQANLIQAKERGSSFVSLNGWRIAIVPLSSNQDLGFATVAEPLSVIDDGLRTLRRDFYAGVPIVLLLASAGGYFLARKSLSPIASMDRQTKAISAGSLSSRLDVTNPRDELGSLAITINDLLSRLENSFNEQQRFIADASHELRTPLAVLRSETEVALNKTRTIQEYQDSLSLIKDEAEQLSRIVEDLFILARQPLDHPQALIKEPVILNDAVRDCARAAQVLANRKGVRLDTESDQQSMVLYGDGELIKRMILNLLDNAVKYTPLDGEIRISLMRQNGKAEIVVRDTGIGIPQAAQSHVFDRFYRVDKARSRSLGGAGLGLSIASWIVEAHNGKISVESTPNRGSTFTIELPLENSQR